MSEYDLPGQATPGLTGTATTTRSPPFVLVSDLGDRERRQRSFRRALSATAFFYAVAVAVACMAAIFVFIDLPMYWTTFQFYRFGLTPLGVIVLALAYSCAVGACEVCRGSGYTAADGGGGRPSLLPIVLTVLHEVWALLSFCFAINDLVNCISTSWCTTVPPSPRVNGYFLTWFIASGVAIIVQIVLIYEMATLYFVRQALCGPAQCRSEMPVAAAIATTSTGAAFSGMKPHRIGKYLYTPELERTFERSMKETLSASKRSK